MQPPIYADVPRGEISTARPRWPRCTSSPISPVRGANQKKWTLIYAPLPSHTPPCLSCLSLSVSFFSTMYSRVASLLLWTNLHTVNPKESPNPTENTPVNPCFCIAFAFYCCEIRVGAVTASLISLAWLANCAPLCATHFSTICRCVALTASMPASPWTVARLMFGIRLCVGEWERAQAKADSDVKSNRCVAS